MATKWVFNSQDMPVDILPPILSQLTDRRDWYACTLVSKTFNRLATPFLYHTLDSRVIEKSLLFHPSTTLLKRPQLAQYVRRVTETGAVHRALHLRYPHVTQDTLSALKLCTNLTSMTWADDISTTDPKSILLSFLTVIRSSALPLRQLTIRTYSDLGEQVWSQLIQLTGLHKISLWCMDGPPRVLQGWSEPLGNTLTHLELGRCAGVPPTILITVLSQLPRLKDLRLKGAPSAAIPTILTYLPNLQSLDTEYFGSGNYRQPKEKLLPLLKHLTVRTSSMDTMGPQKLWEWIRQLLPRPSLQSLTLHAFTNMGQTSIPRMFVLDLAIVHGNTLRHFLVGEAELTLNDIECLCSKFPRLEALVCSVASPDTDSIAHAISCARNLQTLKLKVTWIPNGMRDSGPHGEFTLEHARKLMLRYEGSQLRVIGMGPVLFTGRWVLEGNHGLRFEVVKDLEEDKWHYQRPLDAQRVLDTLGPNPINC